MNFGIAECASATNVVLRVLCETQTVSQLASHMDALTHELGFKHFALIHHDDLRGTPTHRVKLLRYPSDACERIIEQNTWRRDPIIRACTFARRAFLWSELPDFVEIDRRDLECFEAGARVGLNEGITVPCVEFGECMGSCTFAGTRAPKRAAKGLGMAQLIGVFAFEAARRIFVGQPVRSARKVSLHPRPRDCVILTGQGFTDKEIARELGLAPRTVDGYLTEARKVLGGGRRSQLVIRAVLAGEVGLHELKRRQPE
jgi:LuxR family quorum-sensing system transcriptional regulator CciR